MKHSIVLFSLFLLLCTVLTAFAQDEEPFENPTYTAEFIEQQESMLPTPSTISSSAVGSCL